MFLVILGFHAIFLVHICVSVWVLPMDSKLCKHDIIKTIPNYSLVQCTSSCRRSSDCQTVSFTKNREGKTGKCDHLKLSNGTCIDDAVANENHTEDIVSTNKDSDERKAASIDDNIKYQVKSGMVECV